MPDAATTTEDAPTAPVRGIVHVTVLEPDGSGSAAVGATVVFVDTDGTATKVATDISGKASADVFPGASVTSILLVGTKYQMETIFAIKPGDDITLGVKTSTTGTDFTVSLPQSTNTATTLYTVSSPCGARAVQATAGVAPTVALPVNDSCKKNPTEIVAVATDANSNVTGSISVTNVPFLAGNKYVVTSTYQPPRTITASYTNIDSSIATLSMERGLPDAAGVINSVSASQPGATAALSLTAGTATTAQMITFAQRSLFVSQAVYQPLSGTAVTYGLDVGKTLLPWITALPTFDAASNKLTVTTDTTGTSTDKVDLFEVAIRYSRKNTDGTSNSFSWTLFAPDLGDIALPALSGDQAVLIPTANDTVGFDSVVAFEAPTVTSYDAVRNNPIAAINAYLGTNPIDTSVRYTRYTIFKPL